jgi:hypothetical protein
MTPMPRFPSLSTAVRNHFSEKFRNPGESGEPSYSKSSIFQSTHNTTSKRDILSITNIQHPDLARNPGHDDTATSDRL